MNTYIFDNNQDKTNEKIQMIFMIILKISIRI